MASRNADGKREVTDHLGRIAVGESWKRRIERQPPAANRPARIRLITPSARTARRYLGSPEIKELNLLQRNPQSQVNVKKNR